MNKNLMKTYSKDASRIEGKAKDVFAPENVLEIKKIVRECERIVIRGAGTGFSGGAVPMDGLDVVLDLSKMDKIGNFDKERMTVEVEAGVILGELEEFLEASLLYVFIKFLFISKSLSISQAHK